MLYLIVWYAEIWCRESPGDITVNIKNFRFHHSFPVDYIVYWLGNPVRHKILNHIITHVYVHIFIIVYHACYMGSFHITLVVLHCTDDFQHRIDWYITGDGIWNYF